MTCNEIENRLPAYLENLLSPEEKKSIEGHLASCPRCSRACEDLRKAEEFVQDLTEVDPPPFFEQRIMTRVREEAAQKQGILRKLFYPLYIKVPIQAFATILVAVIAFSVYRTGEPELKDLAPPAITAPEPAKDRAKAESGKATVAPASITPVTRTPAADLPEKKQERFIAPAIENGAKADQVSGSRSPLQEKRELAMKPAALDRAGKQEADQSFEASLPEYKRKGEMAHIGAAPAPSQITAATASKRSAVELTIQAKDVHIAVQEVEERLAQVNGRIIERQRRDGREFLKAAVAAQNLEAFLDRIEAIGRVKVEKTPRYVSDGIVTVKIEIANEP